MISDPAPAPVQKPALSRDRQQQLPDPSVDIKLGLHFSNDLLRNRHAITSTPQAKIAVEVFEQMLRTGPIRASNLPFEWDVTILSDGFVNALAGPGGKVYVYNGLAQILADNKALWAAVIGHELAHTAKRHLVAHYMRDLALQQIYLQQKAYYQRRAALGDNSADWRWSALRLGRSLLICSS